MTSLLINDDPGGTAGASKELMEATAKAVLDELGIAYTDREDSSALASRAQQRLGLGAAEVDAGVDDAPSIRRILGGLSSITKGIDELRNAEVAGTDATAPHALVHGTRAWRSTATARGARPCSTRLRMRMLHGAGAWATR